MQAPQAGAPITVWVKRMDVTGAQYVEVEKVDLEQTVSKFKARWVAQEQLGVRPSLVTLKLVKRGAGKPTPTQEAKAKTLGDPSLSLAQAKVTGTTWLLAFVAGALDARVCMLLSRCLVCVFPCSVGAQAGCCCLGVKAEEGGAADSEAGVEVCGRGVAQHAHTGRIVSRPAARGFAASETAYLV